MKRWMIVVLLVLAMALCLVPVVSAAEVVGSGTCGANLTWKLTDDGTLTISGTGPMDNYTYSTAPWYELRNEISEVVIEDGVTSIGDRAFYCIFSFRTLHLPDSVTKIGSRAFIYTWLTRLYILGDPPEIASNAFGELNLTVYYSGDNEKWTEDLMQSYGGTTTWEIYDPDKIVDSGTCGKNVTWTLTQGDVLSISGTGEMSRSYLYQSEFVREIIIHDGVTTIADSAFEWMENLESVTIPGSVTKIGEFAFYECKKLKSIKIADGLTRIGIQAFYQCTGLTEITLPASISTFDHCAFGFCSNLTDIHVEPGGEYYKSIDGVIYDKDGTTLVLFPTGRTGECVIPDGVVNIGDYAFDTCEKITKIVIPPSVVHIGENAFSSCHGLTDILISEGVQSIDDRAFDCCISLTEITLPSSVTSIGWRVFDGCFGLLNIWVSEDSASFSSVDGVLFDSWKSTLVQYPLGRSGAYIVPEETQWIGMDAFTECYGLTDVTFPGYLYSIGNGAFSHCTGLTEVSIPHVSYISNYAFEYCKNLTEIRFSAFSPSIGDYAFDGVTATAYYPDFENIWSQSERKDYGGTITWVAYKDPVEVYSGYCGENLKWKLMSDGTLIISGTGAIERGYSEEMPWDFAKNSIASIVIEEGVTGIGNDIFSFAEDLTTVKIAGSVEQIGPHAFSDCTSLKSVEISDGVKCIDSGAFSHCNELPSVIIPGSVEVIEDYAFNGCSNLSEVTISEGLKVIGAAAFSYCSNLTALSIPASVTDIGNEAFRSCYYLEKIELQEGLITIGEFAFYECDSLTGVSIPKSVSVIGKAAFANCENLKQIDVSDGNKEYQSVDGVLYDISGKKLLQCPGAYVGEYVIGDAVTDIGAYAFCGCSGLTYAVIPETVASIGDHVFYECKKLTAISIPYGITQISEYLFAYCENMTSVSIPKTVTSIDDFAFYCCRALEAIELPDAVERIGRDAFAWCGTLNSIKLPKNLTLIDSFAFSWCHGFTSVMIPEEVTVVGMSAFYRCEGLQEVTFSANVNSIGSKAFALCDKLTDIHFNGNAPAFSKECFGEISATAYYPAGNTTWTEEVMQGYGGTITWVAYHEHNYVAETVSPTCTESGYMNYACECGDSYQEGETVPLGHKFVSNRCKVCGEFEVAPEEYSGDANGDGSINAVDIVGVKNMIQNGEYSVYADADKNGVLTVADLIAIKNRILNGG